MPLGRYPGRVKDFRKWAAGKMDSAELSDSATPSVNRASRGKVKRRRRWRRRKVRKNAQE